MSRGCALVAFLLSCLLPACGPDAAPSGPLGIGDALRTDLTLPDLSGRRKAVKDSVGPEATVFYAWSVPCPCVANAEARVQALVRAHGEDVRWVAVAGEPLDTPEQLREQKLRFGSPYPVLRDPEQELCRILGLDSASMVAVLDGDGVLVYRGPLDDDFVDGRGEYVSEVLAAVLGDRAVPQPLRPATYGCDFNDPASCRRPR